MISPNKLSQLYPSVRAVNDDGLTLEYIDGQIYTSPRPAPRHSLVQTALSAALYSLRFQQNGRGGWWILVEPGLRLEPAPSGIQPKGDVVPDLAGWKRSRMATLPSEQPIAIPPDWICEVLSPSTENLDRNIKKPKYERVGVPYLWLVDLKRQSIEVYVLKNSVYFLAADEGRGKMSLPPFDNVPIAIDELWAKEE